MRLFIWSPCLSRRVPLFAGFLFCVRTGIFGILLWPWLCTLTGCVYFTCQLCTFVAFQDIMQHWGPIMASKLMRRLQCRFVWKGPQARDLWVVAILYWSFHWAVGGYSPQVSFMCSNFFFLPCMAWFAGTRPTTLLDIWDTPCLFDFSDIFPRFRCGCWYETKLSSMYADWLARRASSYIGFIGITHFWIKWVGI